MFEALFILTTLDAGTRVGRFLVQDLLALGWKPLGSTRSLAGNILATALFVAAWGWFLYQGVRDPLGGINSLWPLFGIANQLLAAIALCVGTTIFIKMHRARYMWITAAPLAWLVVVTFTAGYQKIFSDQPRVGFLSEASHLQSAIDTGTIAAGKIAEAQGQIFNDRLDAAVCGVFLIMVALILIDSVRVWFRILGGATQTKVDEAPFVLSRLQTEEL
jgi:carbon starvation protein